MYRKILAFLLGLLLCASLVFGATGDIYFKVGSATTLSATNGYGGAVADLAADGAWDKSSDVVWATQWAYVLVYLEHDSSGTTDNIIMGIATSVDGTDYADNPIYEIEYDATSGADTQEDYVVVYPCKEFQVWVKTGGTTDTFDYRIRYVPVYGFYE